MCIRLRAKLWEAFESLRVLYLVIELLVELNQTIEMILTLLFALKINLRAPS
jgi:hypothetical protein